MKLKEFEFDRVRSGSFGLWINGSAVFNSPDPDVQYTQIPGRSGDLIFNNNRFLNIPVTYPGIFMPRRFVENFRTFKAFLFSHVGDYFVLRDDYQPDFFRMASVDSGIQVSDVKWGPNAGRFDLTFNCKPQLYLVSGSHPVEFTASGKLRNPTLFKAKPIIRVYGSGNVTIAGRSVMIASNSNPYIDIDSEREDCYCGGNNANAYVTIGGVGRPYPVLNPGDNTITKGSGITKIVITPNWWTQ